MKHTVKLMTEENNKTPQQVGLELRKKHNASYTQERLRRKLSMKQANTSGT